MLDNIFSSLDTTINNVASAATTYYNARGQVQAAQGVNSPAQGAAPVYQNTPGAQTAQMQHNTRTVMIVGGAALIALAAWKLLK